MKKYTLNTIKDSNEFEALLFTGNNFEEIAKFLIGKYWQNTDHGIAILRNDGQESRVAPGSYIAKAPDGEFYSVPPGQLDEVVDAPVVSDNV